MLLTFKQRGILEKTKDKKQVKATEKEQGTVKSNATAATAGDPGIKDQTDHNLELGDMHQTLLDGICILTGFHSSNLICMILVRSVITKPMMGNQYPHTVSEI